MEFTRLNTSEIPQDPYPSRAKVPGTLSVKVPGTFGRMLSARFRAAGFSSVGGGAEFFAQTQVFGRDFDQLIGADKLDGLLEAQNSGRSQHDQIVGAGGA